jgi:transcriptional regulator with XRE-family HTH domain
MDAETARRLRAARGYADLSRPALGDALEVSKDTIERIENGRRVLGEFERETFLQRAAAACGLPYEFFTVNFDRLRELNWPPAQLTYRQLEDRDVVSSGDAAPAERARRIRDAIEILNEFAVQAEEEAATEGEGGGGGNAPTDPPFRLPPEQGRQPDPRGEGEGENGEEERRRPA